MPFRNNTINPALRCRCGFVANNKKILDDHSCWRSMENYSNPHTLSSSMLDPTEKKLERERTIEKHTRKLSDLAIPLPDSPPAVCNNPANVSSGNQSDMFLFIDDGPADPHSDGSSEVVELRLVPFGFNAVPSVSYPMKWSSLDLSGTYHGAAGPHARPGPVANPALMMMNAKAKPPSACGYDDENYVNMANVPGCSRSPSPPFLETANSRKRWTRFRGVGEPKSKLQKLLKTSAMRFDEDCSDGAIDGGNTTDSSDSD